MGDYVEVTALVAMQHVPSTAGPIYTGHASRKSKITSVSVTEQAGATQDLDIWLVPDAGSRDISNRVINTLGFTANQVKTGSSGDLSALVGKILMPGTDIHAQASASATALSIQIDGVIFEDPT